jgi:hypothetical protein
MTAPATPKKAQRLGQAEAMSFASFKRDDVFQKAINLTLRAKPNEPQAGSESQEMIRAYAKREGWEQAIRFFLAMDNTTVGQQDLTLDDYQVINEPDFTKD